MLLQRTSPSICWCCLGSSCSRAASPSCRSREPACGRAWPARAEPLPPDLQPDVQQPRHLHRPLSRRGALPEGRRSEGRHRNHRCGSRAISARHRPRLLLDCGTYHPDRRRHLDGPPCHQPLRAGNIGRNRPDGVVASCGTQPPRLGRFSAAWPSSFTSGRKSPSALRCPSSSIAIAFGASRWRMPQSTSAFIGAARWSAV